MNSRVTASDILTPSYGIPLSTSQERLWVLDQLHPHNPVQNIACGLRLAERPDRSRLQTALNEVLRQHEILRAEFHLQDGVPVELVRPTVQLSIDVRDLQNIPPNEKLRELSRLAQEATEISFDLGQAPLLRATLFQLEDPEHVFVVVAHRIVCDEASLRNLLSEFQSRYSGVSGRSQNAAALQYRALVSKNAVSEGDAAYWKQCLESAPLTLDLPADRQRPTVQSFRGAQQKLSISEPLLGRLRALCQSHGSDLFTTFLTAFAVLLSRYTRQDDFVIGTRVSGRTKAEFANVIGPLENMLALRIDASGDPGFLTFLTRVREVTEGAFAHQDFPFETLVKQLHLERDLSRHPVFQVMFTMKDAGGDASAEAALNLFEVDSRTELFDLSVEFTARESQLEATLSYSSDLFDAMTIGRMMEHFKILLEGVVADGTVSISHMPMLSAAERKQLLVEWNDTAIEYPTVECVHQLVEAQVKRTPNAVALVFNGQSLTYHELNLRSNQLAHYLAARGVRAGSLVAIFMDRSMNMLVAVLAILKSGAAYIPLDPAYPRDRLAFMLSDSSPTAVLTQEAMRDQLPPDAANAICIDTAWDDIAKQDAENLESDATREDLVYVIYTSGSTGKPKGVCLPHRALTNLIFWQMDHSHLPQGSRTIQFTSLSFDVSFQEIFSTWCSGGTLVAISESLRRDPIGLLRFLREENIARLFLPFIALQHLAEMAEEEKDLPRHLLEVITAGEQLRVTRQLSAFFQRMPQCSLFNHYGPSETHVVTSFQLTGAPDTWAALPPIGKPIANTQIYILDPFLNPVPAGVSGELYIGGVSLARGYLNRPELTTERFLSDPFGSSPRSHLYKSGDVARQLPDGNIECLGRIDNQVKIRGFRIELGEVESALAQHPAIGQAVVVVREDILGDKRLAAYLVPAAEGLDLAELRGYLAKFLPEYMVPSSFSILPAFPLTPSGKINRRALPAPSPEVRGHSDLIAPRNPQEALLVSIFQRVLNTASVSIVDNFFDLGGHSLLAARMLSEVKKATGREIPLSALFRGPSPESLSRLIDELVDATEPVVMEIQRGNPSRLPFFAIVPPGEESLGYAMLARHMGSQQTVYKIQGHAPVLDGSRPHTKEELQQITAEYVTAIQSAQPHGPYCLGGLCDGTHIAEQIVLHLEAQGEEVGLFAIFDTWVMQHSQIRWLWKVDYYRQRLLQMKKMSFRERIASYKHVAENKVRTATGKKAPRTDWQERYWPENFTPPRFRAPVVLFKRPKQQFYYINDPQLGWGQRSEGGVEVHEIEFHHQEILREPHVARFGELLAERIGRIRNSPQRTESNHSHQNVEATR